MAYDGTAYDRNELDTLLIGLARSTRLTATGVQIRQWFTMSSTLCVLDTGRRRMARRLQMLPMSADLRAVLAGHLGHPDGGEDSSARRTPSDPR